jgi:hypothetical protein
MSAPLQLAVHANTVKLPACAAVVPVVVRPDVVAVVIGERVAETAKAREAPADPTMESARNAVSRNRSAAKAAGHMGRAKRSAAKAASMEAAEAAKVAATEPASAKVAAPEAASAKMAATKAAPAKVTATEPAAAEATAVATAATTTAPSERFSANGCTSQRDGRDKDDDLVQSYSLHGLSFRFEMI